MVPHRLVPFMLGLFLAAGGAILCYFLWQRFYVLEISCQANFVQHHQDDTLEFWLNYKISGDSGILSMIGQSKNDPTKKIDRKVAFSVQENNKAYHFTSQENIKFPDDNVADNWLSKYEPEFFVYSGKSILIVINEQINGGYIFSFSTLPAYICHR